MLEGLEYKNIFLALMGLTATLLWALDFWKVGHVAQLIYPFKTDTKNKSLSISRYLLFGIGIVGWLCISFALTGPRLPLKYDPGTAEVNDIFFVMDVSRSMLVDDLKPNRLEVAKRKIREFVSLRPTDRIGIVLFSERVFTLLPLTTDTKVVERYISEINVGFLGSGTNIGDGLALAVARAMKTETKNKVIILLTDGISNVGNMTPLQAGEYAKEFDIKVYTIGLGTDESARLPVGKNRFGKKIYQNIPGGSIDLATLKKISDMTGGKSYYANSTGSLENILTDIQKLEKTEIKSEGQIVYKELYYQYLLIGVFLFMFVEIIRKFLIREVV